VVAVRVLFSSTWGHGHVLPMVPLARAFAEAGHQVLWAVPGPSAGLVTDAGLTAATAGLDAVGIAMVLRAMREGTAPLPPQQRAGYVFPTMFGAGTTPAMVADLLPLARDWRPDLMVHEQAELGAPLVAAVTGVPSVTHAFGGAVPAAFVVDAGERLAGLWRQHGVEPRPYAGAFASGYLDICPPAVQTVPTDHVGVRHPLRPVAWNPPGEPDAEPAGDAPLVYVTLGTAHRDDETLLAAVQGLGGLDVRVLVAVGPGGDPAALGPAPANVVVRRWVDQAAVLPRCALVVSHTGSGTFLGALAQGLPQLCLPQAADQFRNAEGAARSGTGLVLRPGEVTADAVAAAVSRLLADDAVRTAAGAVAAQIAAMPSPADVVRTLEQVAAAGQSRGT
jgi:UDP:flavonoid glycosyltransferase YjiC (YdhE family)